MTLNDLGNLGEFIGSVAVVITLIYLAIQVRQQTAATKVQIRQAISDAQFANINSRATDDKLPIIIMKANRDENLDQDELDRLYFHLDASLRQFENFFSHFQSSVISDKDWLALSEGLKRTLRTRIGLEMWDSMQAAYNRDFRDNVDNVILRIHDEHAEI